MIYSLRFLPEVEEDIIAGYTWYEDKVLGLGEEFLRMFYARANDIQRNPLLRETKGLLAESFCFSSNTSL